MKTQITPALRDNLDSVKKDLGKRWLVIRKPWMRTLDMVIKSYKLSHLDAAEMLAQVAVKKRQPQSVRYIFAAAVEILEGKA